MLPVQENLPDIELTVFNSGWVPAPENIVLSGGGNEKLRMPALFAMIRHPEHGVILYDTGYSTRFFDATRKFPYRIMRWLTPAEINEEDNAHYQLSKKGVLPGDVKTIIIGHGHVDHVPGIASFHEARIIVDHREWDIMQGPAIKVFLKGYLKSLYHGIKNQIELVDFAGQGKPYGPFQQAKDLWGDGSMILVPLPGHTVGQMGLLVNLADGRRYCFIGDAAWITENFVSLTPPAFLVRGIVSSYAEFKASLALINKFHQEYPEVTIVPCHCPLAWKKLETSGIAGLP